MVQLIALICIFSHDGYCFIGHDSDCWLAVVRILFLVSRGMILIGQPARQQTDSQQPAAINSGFINTGVVLVFQSSRKSQHYQSARNNVSGRCGYKQTCSSCCKRLKTLTIIIYGHS